MKLIRLFAVASAAVFIAGSALAQQGGTVTKNAFAIGKGPGTQGYTSLLCASAQLAVGQSAADPICRTLTGDVTLSAAGVTAIGTAKVTAAMIASITSAQLATILSDETGTGANVFANSPVLVTPNLGTPSALTLTNATGLPVGGISGLGTGVATWLATPSSANLAAAMTNETGTGALVFGTSPNITTPTGIVKGDVGLGSVDNTSDATKWAATKTLTNTTYDTAGTGNAFSINGVAANANTGTGAIARASAPAFTNPTANTQTPSDNSTKLATTAYVDAQVAGGVAGVASYNGRTGIVTATGTDVPLRGYLTGLTLSTAGSSSSFGVAIGVATDSTAANMMALGSAYTKTTSAWAVGSGNGSLDTGAIANNTWYHAYLIKRLDTGVTDVLTSLSTTAPTLPTNYTISRRIGSMLTNGSGQWVSFNQNGDKFQWANPVLETGAAIVVGNSRVTQVLTVPTGVVVDALFNVISSNAVNTVLWIGSLSTGDATPSISGAPGFFTYINGGFVSGSAVLPTMTDTSARVAFRADQASTQLRVSTVGWIDSRGR